MKANLTVLILLIIAALVLGAIIIGTAPPAGDDPQDASASEAEIREFTDQELAVLTSDYEKGLLLLVDKEHPVDQYYAPADLTKITHYAADRTSEGRFMRSEAAAAFDTMCEAALAEGLEIVSTTAYRSYDFQASLYSYYTNLEGQEWADANIAKPGVSEHQTGLAADCSSASVQYELVVEYADTPEGTWLREHAYQHGFIIRYPENKQDVTGYVYEPWHIRYVGITAAKYINDNNLTLEEFLQDRFRD